MERINLKLLIAVPCFILAAVCSIWGLTEILSIGPRSLMDDAVKGGKLPYSQDWQAPYELMSFSALLRPHDAIIQFELGRISWWHAAYVRESTELRANWLNSSAQHLEKAVALRPIWGRAWAELANIYFQSGKPLKSGEALSKAMALAPYEGNTQWMIMETGFAIWPLLEKAHQRKFLHIAKYILGTNRERWVIRPAVVYGREHLIREMITSEEGIVYLKRALQKYRNR